MNLQRASKYLEYITKGHIRSNVYNIILNLKWLYSLISYSGLV